MTLFEKVKTNVTTLQAAERYGMRVKRGGMCRCPFHNDKNPSMKIDTRFHCFGCQADGDVIDFTSRLFNLTPMAAAQKLADDFGIQHDRNQKDIPVKKQHTVSDQDVFLHKVSYCYQELASYRNLLVQWQQQYAPRTPDEEPHPRFMEAIRNLEMVEYDLDLLQGGEEPEKLEIVNDYLRDEQEQREAISMEPIVKTPVYHQSAAYAREHGELEQYRQSHRANIDCKRDIEKTVSAHFDGMRLERKAAPEVIERFGAERVALVLAATNPGTAASRRRIRTGHSALTSRILSMSWSLTAGMIMLWKRILLCWMDSSTWCVRRSEPWSIRLKRLQLLKRKKI